MRNQKVLDMAFMSVFLVIIILMAAVPQFGFINFPLIPGVGFTLIHIPVIIASIYFGYSIGGFSGLVFGISSFLVSWIRPVTPLDPLFRNPLISIVPRVAFALITVLIYRILNKYVKNKYTVITLTSVVGTFIHTALVVPLLGLFGAGIMEDFFGLGTTRSIMQFIKITFVFNGIAEMILAGLIVPPIVFALKSFNNHSDNSSIINEIENK